MKLSEYLKVRAKGNQKAGTARDGEFKAILDSGLRQGFDPEGSDIVNIELESLRPNPYQPRKGHDAADIEQLAASIKERGLLQPVLVRKRGDGFELLAGHRRVEACRSLGHETIAAILVECDDLEAAQIALVENLQRKDLNPLEEAEGYRTLMVEFGLTQQAIASGVGKGQSTIANKLRLLDLGPEVKAALAEGRITERHGRALLRLPLKEQAAALEQVLKQDLTVRQTEELVERLGRKDGGKSDSDRRSARVRDGGRRLTGAFPDSRVVLNTFKEIADKLRGAGVQVSLDQEESDEWWEARLRIHKRRTRDGGGAI